MKPEETIDFHIRWLWAKIAKRYNAEATQSGGTMSIGYVLLNIDQKKGSPSTSLGPAMGMEATSLTRLLNRMEDLELIVRQKDQSDGRMVRVFLTDKGKEMRLKSRQSVLKFNQEMQEVLTNEELTMFYQIMNKINNVLDIQ